MAISTIIENSGDTSSNYGAMSEFRSKERILTLAFKPVAPMDYIYKVWYGNGKDDMVILLQNYKKCEDGTSKGTYFSIGIEEIFDLMIYRNDLYSYYTDFRNGKVCIKTVEKVRAFCIDLDHMSPKDLQRLISRKFRKMEFPPSYIVNSGNGVHLVFLFEKPVDVSSGGRIFPMKKILKELTEQFRPEKSYSYKLDGQSANLIQPYRVPGSLTKYGDVSSVYESGPEYKLEDLEKWFGCKLFNKAPHKNGKGKRRDCTKKGDNIASFPTGKPKFYDYCLEKIRVPDKTSRYMAMFGLAIVAWKCRIEKSKVTRDLNELLYYYNEHASGNPGGFMKNYEVEKAMGGYSNRFVRVTADKLSEYLGIKFKKAKRNGLTQDEHLRKLAAEKSSSNRQLVFDFINSHPEYTQKHIAEVLDMSPATVHKYRTEYYMTRTGS